MEPGDQTGAPRDAGDLDFEIIIISCSIFIALYILLGSSMSTVSVCSNAVAAAESAVVVVAAAAAAASLRPLPCLWRWRQRRRFPQGSSATLFKCVFRFFCPGNRVMTLRDFFVLLALLYATLKQEHTTFDDLRRVCTKIIKDCLNLKGMSEIGKKNTKNYAILRFFPF